MRQIKTLSIGLLFSSLLALGACSSSDEDKDGGTNSTNAVNSKKETGPEPDTNCSFPPLSYCERPGTRPICPDNWYCPGCSCAGPSKAAACSVLTQDCRYFCTGCIPEGYVYCTQDAPPAILGRCSECFFDEDGNLTGKAKESCMRLDEILDAQPPKPADDAG